MERFGQWTAYERDGRKQRCVCDCGAEAMVSRGDLLNGKSKRCSRCAQLIRAAAAKAANTRHGRDGTAEYRTWIDIRRRCHQPQRPDFHRYGGRGIYVCDEWRAVPGGFEAFLRDMGERPSPKHTLDRIDNDGPYAPWNCRWATREEQGRNTRQNVFVTIDGERMTKADAARIAVVNSDTFANRVNTLGWDAERAAKTPKRRAK